jgi:glycosyltransferase involved in cell wall biosynthesis
VSGGICPNPRLGLQVFGTRTGLGYQTRALYRHLEPAKAMLIDMSRIKGMPCHREWYGPEVSVTDGIPTDAEVDEFLAGLDVVLVCETPLNYHLFSEAQWRGIATIEQYNYEFTEHLTNPRLPLPAVFAAPTSWNLAVMQTRFSGVRPLPVPVDREGLNLPRRRIETARTFFHVAGQPTTGDRNGTLDFIDVARRCADLDVEWLLYCQVPNAQIRQALAGAPIQLVTEVAEPRELYSRGDILILPRRYGGLCLPTIEALASGIPVLMPDVSPNRDWLPPEWLVPARWVRRTAGTYPPVPVDVFQVDVAALAAQVRELAVSPDVVAAMGDHARIVGDGLTWEALLPRYMELIQRAKDLKS